MAVRKWEKTETEASFILSPNLATRIYTVTYRLEKGQTGELTVWNSFGELKAEYELNDRSRENIKIEDLSSGIYFVQLSVDGKLVGVQKLIKL